MVSCQLVCSGTAQIIKKKNALVNIQIFWKMMMMCPLVSSYECFRVACYLHCLSLSSYLFLGYIDLNIKAERFSKMLIIVC